MRAADSDLVLFSADAPPMRVREGNLYIWLVRPSRWPAVGAFLPDSAPGSPAPIVSPREERRLADLGLGRALLTVLLRECNDCRRGAPLYGALARAEGLLAIAIGRVGRISLTLAAEAARTAGAGVPIPGLPDGYHGAVRTAVSPHRLLVATLHAERPAMTVHYRGAPLVSTSGRPGPRFAVQ